MKQQLIYESTNNIIGNDRALRNIFKLFKALMKKEKEEYKDTKKNLRKKFWELKQKTLKPEENNISMLRYLCKMNHNIQYQ